MGLKKKENYLSGPTHTTQTTGATYIDNDVI